MIVKTMSRSIALGTTMVGLCILGASTALAGDLNPPPGAIAPTMLRLDQIEPRIIVNDLPGAADAVHVISTDGNYVLTADITAGAGQHGILVTAGEVTLDLNGFTLRGLQGSFDAVLIDSPIPASTEDVFSITGRGTVATGRIERSISGFGGNGVTVLNAVRVSLAGLRISDCGGNGIDITTSSATNTADCRIFQQMVTGCGGNGIDVVSQSSVFMLKILDCTSQLNLNGASIVVNRDGANDLQMKRCTFSNNAALGLSLADTPGATANRSLQYAGVGESKASGNGTGGIQVLMTSDSFIASISNCRGIANGGPGVDIDLTAVPNSAVSIRGSSFHRNIGDGVRVSSEVCNYQDDDCNFNGGDGFNFAANTVVMANCTASGNLGNGATFSGTAGGGSGSGIMTVRDSSFTGNTLDGVFYVRDREGNYDCFFDVVVASNNGGGGFVSRGIGKASPAVYMGCVANGNGGSGFDQGAGIVRYDQCTASKNGGDGFNIAGGAASLTGCSSINNGSHGYGVVGDSFFLDGTSSQGNAGDGFNFVADSVVMAGCRAISNLGDGMNLAAGFAIAISRFECEKGVANNNGGHGIAVLNADLKLRGGSYGGNGGSGISASNSSLYCSNVTVTENLFGGVLLADYGRLTMGFCSMDNNTGNGLAAFSSLGLLGGPITLRGCSFTGNTNNGCSIASSIGGQVTECSAFNNGVRGIEVLSSGHVLTGNVAGANPLGNVFASLGNAVGPAVGGSIIGGDNNFANPRP